MNTLFSLYDSVDPADPQGRTYRQVNEELTHNIPMGSLVELVSKPDFPHAMDGIRLFVVYRGRDCDMTPMYWLCADPECVLSGNTNNDIITKLKWHGGFSEDSLEVIR